MTTVSPGRHILSLNGDDWQLYQAEGQEPQFFQESGSLPATVPGDVRLDLVRAGRLPDPYLGRNSLEAQWVDAHDWWLVRDLEGLELPPGRRVFLRLHGVDYLGDVYFDGHHLGRHEGMFSPQLFEVTRQLTTDHGVFGLSRGTRALAGQELAGKLAVRVAGAGRLPGLDGKRVGLLTRWRDRREGRLEVHSRWDHRRSTLKCQMGFGWDFAPDLPSLGIWDDVELIVTGGVFIRDVRVHQVLSDDLTGPARLDVTLDLDVSGRFQAEIGLNLFGLNCEAPPQIQLFPVNLEPGQQRFNLSLDVPEPSLWWPWDHGEPNLYSLLVTVRRRAELLDSVNQTVGLRRVQMTPNPDAPEGVLPWVFLVNGQRVFLRGANWVPASVFPGQVMADDYQELLDLARAANMNALRVWGGGLREKAAFYDICDRTGLLVWQEFPLACAFLTRYPRSGEYLALVDRETRAIVRTLRHHPSVILWSGGNEFDPARNAPVVETMAAVVAAEDPTRPFVPASPTGGDNHNWEVWHGFAPAITYRDERSQFASEFGLQAPPVEESLRQFIPEDELWPPGPSWAHHHAQWPKLWRYAAPLLDGRDDPEQVTLEEFLAASQRAQAYSLQIAIEHHRRRKYACGGCLFWQFNTPWPAIEWAVVDHYRRPKLAYETVKNIYNPVLVSLEYALDVYEVKSQFRPTVWVINDRPEPLPDCHLEVTLETLDGVLLERYERKLDLPADSAEAITHFTWRLPIGARLARCRLRQGDELISFNEYDLRFYDPGQPSRRQRFETWLGKRLLGRD